MTCDFKNENLWLMKGDCLERMKDIPDGSVDMILADVPYGTTACKWDSIIPLEPMWEQLKRIIKPNGAIVMTAAQPFTTVLISSNMKMFKYCWVWNKKKPGGIGFAKYQPMRVTEDVVVFSNGSNNYYPIMVDRDAIKKSRNYKRSEMNNASLSAQCTDTTYTKKYPKNLLEFSNANQRGKVHPTQKPVALMEYLIKTYTNEGETVLDFTAGSFTTGVACVNLDRKFIGIEMDEKYFEIGSNRVLEAVKEKSDESTC